jgi:uncharacterized Zn finger protein
MTKKQKQSDPFAKLAWDDLDLWAGSSIVGRGEKYQRQGRVSDLARTADGGLIGWVDGSERYATKVVMGEDGLPDSVCTCPYGINCKHGVAVVLEYLEQVESEQPIPQAGARDKRLALLSHEGGMEESGEIATKPVAADVKRFVQDQSKDQLVKLLLELAKQHPEIAQDLSDRRQLLSGSTKTLVARLRKEIHQTAARPGWQSHWDEEGYTPDYSEIRAKLEALLQAGHADEVLSLGQELIKAGLRQAEESDDEGETATEVASCLPVIVEALDRSSLAPPAKLAWAVDAVLQDPFDMCEPFAEYLDRRHPKAAWDALADQLLARLQAFKSPRGDDSFMRNYARDRLSDWVIVALEQAGRADEIIPLCEAEARRTKSYERLVGWLLAEQRYEEAERWIREGIRATERDLPGIGSSLRSRLKEIRTARKDSPGLAALEVEEFVYRPSQKSFVECQEAGRKIRVWPQMREHLLAYLENGTLPWKQKDWPLPATGLDAPTPSPHESFPMFGVLIEIAISEKDPERVLYWYDRRSQSRSGWWGIDDGQVASAIETYAPDRAVAIWRGKAERAIAQVNAGAYEEAGRYLRQAGAIMAREGKQQEWAQYLQDLRRAHARKSRLMEVLDRLDRGPIIAQHR